MCASRRSAVWPQVLAIALMGLGAAGCTDSSRFSDFDSDRPRGDVVGSAPQPPGNRIESRAVAASQWRWRLRRRPRHGLRTSPAAAVRSPAPCRRRRRRRHRHRASPGRAARPITVAPGETLETISRRYDVPVAAIMEANNITRPGSVHPGQHLVIPHRRGPADRSGGAAAACRLVGRRDAVAGAGRAAPQRAGGRDRAVHIVAPGETLHSIARHYGKPVLVLAKANNIAPDTHGAGSARASPFRAGHRSPSPRRLRRRQRLRRGMSRRSGRPLWQNRRTAPG